jgi:hypothetical protein
MKKLADEILAKYEDANEYHFHRLDRAFIIDAMIEFYLTVKYSKKNQTKLPWKKSVKRNTK